MPLEKHDVIDAAGIERDTGKVVLTLTDAWDWSDETAHVNALRIKLNNYFEFIKSGQIAEVYPNVKDPRIRIDIISQYPLVPSAEDVIRESKIIASDLHAELEWHHNAA